MSTNIDFLSFLSSSKQVRSWCFAVVFVASTMADYDIRNFMGHIIPAACFIFVAAFMLLIIFMRLRALALNSPEGRPTYCQKHVPENNLKLLKNLSLAVSVCAGFGIFYEGFLENGFVEAPVHPTLYSLYFFPGLVGLLESFGKLPPDSNRVAIAVAVAGEAILWNEHAAMQEEASEGRIHSILAVIAFGQAALFVASIQYPHKLSLVLGSYLGFIYRGSWLALIAFHGLVNDPIQRRMIGVYLVLQGLGLAFLIVASAVYLGSIELKGHKERIMHTGHVGIQYETVGGHSNEDGATEKHLI